MGLAPRARISVLEDDMRYAKVVVTLAAALVLVAVASAQTTRQTASTDTAALDALTTEIRALRADLAESSRAGLRLQLLTARIQAQEQRIIYLDRQRVEASSRRVNMEGLRNETAAQSRQFTASELSGIPSDQRRDFELMMGEAKRRLAEQERQLQQAQVDENEVINALSQEQSRWGDLNARLDDLERTLGAR
jgi:hypothetical protein